MKKILFFVFLLIGFQVFGQPTNYVRINQRYRWVAGMFDSTLHIPSGATNSLRTGGWTGSGALFYNTTDSSVYIYTGTQWLRLLNFIAYNQRFGVEDATATQNRLFNLTSGFSFELRGADANNYLKFDPTNFSRLSHNTLDGVNSSAVLIDPYSGFSITADRTDITGSGGFVTGTYDATNIELSYNGNITGLQNYVYSGSDIGSLLATENPYRGIFIDSANGVLIGRGLTTNQPLTIRGLRVRPDWSVYVDSLSSTDTTTAKAVGIASDGKLYDMGYWPGGGGSTFVDNTWIMNDDLDATKQLQFQLSGISTSNIRTLTIPDASGTIALSNISNNWGDGIKQSFNPNGTNAGINVGGNTGNPSSPADGDLFYEFGSNELRARINGAWVALGAGSGSGTVNSGDANKATYYPSTGTTVDDWIGVEFGNTNLNTKITAQATTEVPLEIKLAASQTANALNISSSAGTGDLLELQADGDFNVDGNTLRLNAVNNKVTLAGDGAPVHLVNIGNTATVSFGLTSAALGVVNGANSYIVAKSGASGPEAYFGAEASVGLFGTFTNHALNLRTNNTNRGSITATGDFGFGTVSPSRRVSILTDDATTNAVTYVLRLTHTTSGTPANGIGPGVEFEAETAAGNNEIGATIEAVTTDVTATSEDFDLLFKTMSAGAAATEKLRITSDGRVYGTALHNNSGSLTGTTNQYIASGTHTPTATNGTNVQSSTVGETQWIRVGNVVTVTGQIEIDCTTAGSSSDIDLSLPIASGFTNTTQASGVLIEAVSGVSSPGHGVISSNATDDRITITFTPRANTSLSYRYTYNYQIL